MKKTLALIILLTFSLTSIAYAEEDVRGALDSIEAERKEKVEKKLLLDLPEISDNPTHIITFRDPSGEGIFLEIDGQKFKEITSPHTLPSLGLGRHTLIFRFTDEEETEQTLERSLTIIPRSPIISPPEINDETVKIRGTAMPNTEVDLFLTNKTYNHRETTQVNPEGEWEYTFEEIKPGTHTLIGTTRSRGFASQYSEPLVFTIEGEETQQQDEDISEILALGDLNLKDIKGTANKLIQDRNLIIILLIFFSLGFLIGWILLAIITKIIHNRSKKVFKEMLNKKKDLTEENKVSSSSLKNKLENTKNGDKEIDKEDFESKFVEIEDKEEEPKEEKIKKNKKKEKEKEEEEEEPEVFKTDIKILKEEEEKENEVEPEKEKEEEEKMATKTKNVEKSISLSKEEFLEKYKEFDPDNDKGEEIKKNIKISLTSKD